MNPQTQSRSGDQDPGTPVIIKTGGNQDGGPILISSPDMPFTWIFGSTNDGWQKAQSTSTGRICRLKFRDGALPEQFCTISPQPEVLASLEVHHVADGRMLFEVKEVRGQDAILLQIICFADVA